MKDGIPDTHCQVMRVQLSAQASNVRDRPIFRTDLQNRTTFWIRVGGWVH